MLQMTIWGASRLLQVLGKVEWNQNVDAVEGTTGGTEDVGEGEAALVRVPRSDRKPGQRALEGAFGEPENEDGVEESDQGSDAKDRRFLARL
ncbi:MAG: hypothetical protein IPI67_22335 [Myxococcales bacterium]|nr:hypothetical protein [Myxococcales bacterium]